MSRHSLPRSPAADAETENDASIARPSKSQRKREMLALQALGESLLALPGSTLARIELPESLRQAIGETARIKSHEARRRQMQFIGKLMRQIDPAQLRTAIDNATGESKQAVALMHRCERMRDRLLDDDAALHEVLATLPQADAQHLRATIRAARRERDDGRPPKHARELYRWLHQQLGQELEAG